VTRGVSLLAILATALPFPAVSQGSQPLRKTDLIRLLSNPLISKREVADLIRRNCVAFRPTPRDWTDLRDFGADTEVLGSIGGCATARAAARPPLTATLLTERVSVTVGATVVARVQVKRGDVPQAAIPLVLRGSARIPGGPPQDVQATTAAGGVASFQFPVGQVPGTYRLEVVTGAGYTLPGATVLEVLVSPATPPAAEVSVSRPRPDVAASATTDFISGVGQHAMAGTQLSEPLLFRVRSSAGAPLAGKRVALRAVNAELPADTVVTDSVGLVRIEVTLGKQAGPALVTAAVDSVQKQAALVVVPAGPVGVIIEQNGKRVDGGTISVPAGRPFRIRVSPQDAYGNPVSTTDLARLIQQLRAGFNVRSRLLKVTGVDADGPSALVTFTPLAVGEVNLSIAGATVSVQIGPAR
jgi:hypothetical protein